MKFFQKKSIKKYLPIIFFIVWFILFLCLSFFRDAQSDENIYLGESAVITDLLAQGQWIGNYGVGLHGFLTKLIIGIIFLFTGPSVFIATLFNISLGILSGVVFYHILKTHFSFDVFLSLLGTTILFCSFQFLTYIPTFYRDIGCLLFVLLTLNSVLSGKNKWITGLFLMLILDSKEHVFYTLAPAFLIWIVIECWQKNKKMGFQVVIKEFILSGFQIFLPSLIYLILMFATSVIPLNIYNANILGLIDEGLRPLVINFNPNYATINRDLATNPDLAKVIPIIKYTGDSSSIWGIVVSVLNVIFSYIGKISYPRTFSFLSIPFLILIPSLATAGKYFKNWIKKMEYEKLFLPIAIFVYLIIYIVHASISRYLLPISPLIYVFFLLFLKDISRKQFKFNAIFGATVLFVSLGLFFEYSYILVKVVFSIIFLSFLWFLYKSKARKKHIMKYFIILLISGFTISAALLASYKNGQIGASLIYGYNRECEKILSLVEEDEVIWINDIGWDRLPFVLRSENVQDPEWRWALQEWMPKKDMLIVEDEFSTYSFRWRSESMYKSLVKEWGISKVVYIELLKEFKNDQLSMQGRKEQISEFNWLELEDTIRMKNKIVYLYNVIEE